VYVIEGRKERLQRMQLVVTLGTYPAGCSRPKFYNSSAHLSRTPVLATFRSQASESTWLAMWSQLNAAGCCQTFPNSVSPAAPSLGISNRQLFTSLAAPITVHVQLARRDSSYLARLGSWLATLCSCHRARHGLSRFQPVRLPTRGRCSTAARSQ
jgi:hypothetical protein